MTESTKRQLVIYHANCIDGFTSAWVAWLWFGYEAEYLSANYGDAPPDVLGRDVLIVDFSYPRAIMEAMRLESSSILVLDHHKTAQDDLEGLSFATFDMNRSGAGLTWDELFKGEVRPWLVNYVEDRDLWKLKYEKSKEVNAWIGTQVRDSFESWSKLNSEGSFEAANKGSIILQYVNHYVQETAKNARMVCFCGFHVPIVNSSKLGISELLHHLAKSNHFAIGWFQRSDGKYEYSLRSEGDFDVSALAKQFGGGGHQNAAGFTLTKQLLEGHDEL
jgi:uncharacterized protein